MIFVKCSICGELCVNPAVLDLHRVSAHREDNSKQQAIVEI
jgi:hypothetical protein